MENNQSLLNGDFIPQVMNQYDGRPVEMMKYVEDYVAKEERMPIESIDPILPAPTSPPRQLTNGPTTIENDGVVAMDTRERDAKRRRDQPAVTRQKSKSLLEN